jgi:hypothetical protein
VAVSFWSAGLGGFCLKHWRLFARFGRDRKAGPATEFAIIGSVFFLILCAIFTLSLDMYWQMTLDTATRAATRQMQIGKITTGAAFATAVCSEFGLVSGNNCSNSLQYSVQTGLFFGTASSGIIGSAGSLTSTGLTGPANFPSAITMSAAGGAQLLLVQVAMPVPFVFMRGLSAVVAQNGTNYLYSAVATVMEP